MWAGNILAPRSSWGDCGTSNHNCGVHQEGPYSNVAMAWGTTVPSHTAYMTWSLEILLVAARHFRDYFCHVRRRELDCRRSRSRNYVVNLRVNWCGYDQEGPVDQ